MTELGKLIESASRANHGRSMQAAAELATRNGEPISKSHISKNTRKIESLTPQLVRGIAAGYGLAVEDVIRAVLADLGLPISDYNPTVESQIRRDPDLSSESKEMLLAAVAAARSIHRLVDDDAEGWPPPQWRAGGPPDSGDDEWGAEHVPRAGQG